MRLWRRRHGAAAALGLATLAALLLAGGALGAWAGSAIGGPESLVSATLDAPTGISVVRGTCVKHSSYPLVVSWTGSTSPAVAGYEIFQSTTSGGPYTSLGTVSAATRSYTDSSTTYNTTYYYVVKSLRNTWRSAASAQGSALTYNSSCK
ncbi:MAG TPA: hypothetical protein VFJ91_03305 [Gaiellaceae bacterium]|nr:hypothetical protein [Gaiellaceae bacterium]